MVLVVEPPGDDPGPVSHLRRGRPRPRKVQALSHGPEVVVAVVREAKLVRNLLETVYVSTSLIVCEGATSD